MFSRLALLTGSALALAIVACGGSTSSPSTPAPAPSASTRPYSGTASVGDFLRITLDATAHTIAYTNVSNGDAGTVSYTVNPDGTYAITDPNANLVTAYEIPGYALIIRAMKTGPNHNTESLITAVQTQPISQSSISNRSYNYMQFRTNSGGLEIGSLAINGSGDVAISGYWPYGDMSGGGAFHQGGFSGSLFLTDPSGSFLKMDEGSGQYSYVFGTSGGFFAVDTPNGAIVSLNKAASKDFQASYAGTYKAISYRKVNAQTGMGNVETGTSWVWTATIDISAGGVITISDGSPTPIVQTQLVPVADAAYLQGPGQLSDPCFGLFTFRVTTANSQQDVFVSFLDHSILFSSYKTALPLAGGNTYEYLYGVGLK